MNGFPLTVVAEVAFLGGFGRPIRLIRGYFHDSRYMRWISLISFGLYKGGFRSKRWISWISLFRQTAQGCSTTPPTNAGQCIHYQAGAQECVM